MFSWLFFAAAQGLEFNMSLFSVQIGTPGEYKLCMLQFWVPPTGPKDSVVVLGVDEIGTIDVQDLHPKKPAATETQAEEAAEIAEEETAEVGDEQIPPQPAAKEEMHTSTNVSKTALTPGALVKETQEHTIVKEKVHKTGGATDKA